MAEVTYYVALPFVASDDGIAAAAKIIGPRINASEAAEDISRLIGDQEIERRTKSETRADGKVSITESTHHETRRVVTASELASRLGPTKKGVRVLFMGLGEDVYELELPYIELPRLGDERQV